MNLFRVVTALCGHNNLMLAKLIQIVRILQRRRFKRAVEGGGFTAHIGGCEENGRNIVEIVLFKHALHQHGTNHAAPTYKTY